MSYFSGQWQSPCQTGTWTLCFGCEITKPVNGTATAVFTVTLTGYATTKEGAPVPVSVGYATREASATTANNFTPVKGNCLSPLHAGRRIAIW